MNSNGKQIDDLSGLIDAIIRRMEGALEPSQYSQLFDSDIVSTIIKWRESGTLEPWQYSQLFDFANAALAMLHRNCDVCTVKEQERRHNKFCTFSMPKCSCENTYECISCFAHWAQMLYERGVKNGSR